MGMFVFIPLAIAGAIFFLLRGVFPVIRRKNKEG